MSLRDGLHTVTVPERASWPMNVAMIVGGALVGVLLSVLIALSAYL